MRGRKSCYTAQFYFYLINMLFLLFIVCSFFLSLCSSIFALCLALNLKETQLFHESYITATWWQLYGRVLYTYLYICIIMTISAKSNGQFLDSSNACHCSVHVACYMCVTHKLRQRWRKVKAWSLRTRASTCYNWRLLFAKRIMFVKSLVL